MDPIFFVGNLLLRLLIMVAVPTMPIWWFVRKGLIKFDTALAANVLAVIILSLWFNRIHFLMP